MDQDSGKAIEALLRVSAANLVAGKSLAEGASLLDRLGVERSIIAAIYDTTPGSVRAALSNTKKGRTAPRPNRGSEDRE